MNASAMILEIAVLVLGLGVLLIDLWTAPEGKRFLGYGAAAGLFLIFVFSFFRFSGAETQMAFGGMYVVDGLALFFKRFFLAAAIIVILMSVEFSDRIEAGIAEFYSLITFALCGMMFAASVNDFTMLFVAMELITVSFYILTSFQRGRLMSLEAGVKYLILGALASAFLVYGIALVYGTAGTMKFAVLAERAGDFATRPLFLLGLLLIVIGLGFKIAAFPLQIWAPDVYQGAPIPSTAFLAVGSKAAGFVLLWRVLFFAVPQITGQWTNLLIVIAAVTILYGNLCALPQRNIKRLFGYSSIAHAGYLLLGVAAMAADVKNVAPGGSAILYYLSGYLFTVLGAFLVLCLALRHAEVEDVSSLAGLNQRSPLLAGVMTLAMVSLAGIPPLAGFFGKFLLLKAALDRGAANHGFYCLAGVAIVGVVISLYYYFGVIRAMYWSASASDAAPVRMPAIQRALLYVCAVGMLYLGLYPSPLVKLTTRVAGARTEVTVTQTAPHAQHFAPAPRQPAP
jgi:NADH-quinone oxidoreductase subunit N